MYVLSVVHLYHFSFTGQILAALERRHSFGRDRHLTIDEQIASGKKRRTSEAQPHKSRTEMVADFVRRSFKRTKAPADVVPETGEAANTAAESESEGGATKMEVKSDAAEMEREATVVISNESAAAEEVGVACSPIRVMFVNLVDTACNGWARSLLEFK